MSRQKYINPQVVRELKQYSRSEQIMRVLWMLGSMVFQIIPRPFHRLRCALLRMFGAQVGQHCSIANSARIFYPWKLKVGDYCAIGDWALIYNLGQVSLGDRVTVSHCAHLCAGTHDITLISSPLLKLPINLASESWICANAFVGPGVDVGFGSIVGAGAVVVKNVAPEIIVAGNPAVFLRPRPIPKDIDS